ncbi:MAG: putative N-acyltransferase, GNAT family [Candidatus Nitrotoga sp. SPKER]|nr:MAG: putative N-acyltransferase, GNAT family [Candidatus Nitrotoga sp. SPKER]
MREQGVSAEMEWDGLDEACQHVLALSATGDAIGCGRISADGHIGRIAVLPEWRGKRVGSSLLELLLDYARSQHYVEVALGAQIQAVPFYLRFNFAEVGEIFMDANIPHIEMQLCLKDL